MFASAFTQSGLAPTKSMGEVGRPKRAQNGRTEAEGRRRSGRPILARTHERSKASTAALGSARPSGAGQRLRPPLGLGRPSLR